MKKINNFKLKICMLIFVLVLMIVQVGPFLVYADESRLTFSWVSFGLPCTNEYYNGNGLAFAKARVGQHVGYCLDYGVPLPTGTGGTVQYLRKLSPVTTAVIRYGYPNVSAASLGVNSDEEAEFATQIAVWGVVNSSNSKDSYKTSCVLDMDNLKPTYGYEAYMTRVKAAARRLMERAWADPYYSNPKCYINPANAKMNVGSEYMLAGPYEIKATGFEVSSISVSLSNAPSSAQITDANGNAISKVNNGTNVYVKLPKTLSGSELTLNVTASGSTAVGKAYGTGNMSDAKQDYGIVTTEPVQLSDSCKVKWSSLTGNVRIYKVDQYGTKIPGVKFDLKDMNNNVVASGTTDTNGILEFKNLKVGRYKLVEVSVPSNYIMAKDPFEFEVTTGTTKEITFQNKKVAPGKIQITKIDQNNNTIPGCTFELKDANGKVIYTGTTDKDGILSFDNLEQGKYYLQEVSAPEGYEMKKDAVEIDVPNNKIVTLKFPNRRVNGGLKIIKVDENQKPLEGVKFEILDANKKVIDTITTNKDGIAVTTAKLTVGTYYYREISAPDNIIIDTNEYQFKINGYDEVVIKNIVNKIKKGRLTIHKVTEGDNKPLANVTFEILDANKNVVDTIVTDANGNAVTKELPEGKYYYRETKVPEGIKLDTTEHEFTMGYQSITKEVVNEYSKGKLKIIKVDENDKPLEGVTFQILDENKNVVDTIVTNKEGIAVSTADLTVGKYYYKEISAPNNIIIDTNEYEFKISKDNEVVIKNIVNKIKKGRLTIHKVSEGDKKPIANVTFQILDANKKVVDTIVTDANGNAVTKELPEGKYYYKEVKVPAEYKLDETEYEFTMDYQDVTKEVVNKYANGKLKILKVDENDIPLKGIEFEIYDENKNLVDTIVTNEKGEAISKDLPLGKYYYKETKAPENVIIDNNMYEFKISKDNEVVIKNVINKLIKGKLKIVKTTETGTPVPNVTFQILNEAKEVIETITTDKDGIAETKLLQSGKYYYREIEAPVNVIADLTEYEFIVATNDEVIEKEVINKLVKGSLKIVKTDDLKAPLANVKFEILDKDKKVIQTIVTDEKGIAISDKLTIGKYYYREVEAPENVVMDTKEHEFKVTENNQVIEKEIENKRIEGKLIIYKKDKDTKKPIEGVTFQVLNEAKEVIATITTDKDGIARQGELLKGKYYFKEIEAPEEYIMNTKEFSFEIKKDMQTEEVTVFNEHKKLPVTGGFIGTNTLIVIIVSVVVIAGYVVVKLVLNRKNEGHDNN